MKKGLLIVILVLTANMATAADFGVLDIQPSYKNVFTEHEHYRDETVTEKYLILTSLAAFDYMQSVDFFFKREGYHEINPILGKYPSRADMMTFGVVGVLSMLGAQQILPEGMFTVLMDSVIATEAFNVLENSRLDSMGKREINTIVVILKFKI